MLSHDPCVHRSRMYAADRGKLPAKPAGVERCAGADHIDRASRPAPREVLGEDIERTCRHETDARKATHLDAAVKGRPRISHGSSMGSA